MLDGARPMARSTRVHGPDQGGDESGCTGYRVGEIKRRGSGTRLTAISRQRARWPKPAPANHRPCCRNGKSRHGLTVELRNRPMPDDRVRVRNHQPDTAIIEAHRKRRLATLSAAYRHDLPALRSTRGRRQQKQVASLSPHASSMFAGQEFGRQSHPFATPRATTIARTVYPATTGHTCRDLRSQPP